MISIRLVIHFEIAGIAVYREFSYLHSCVQFRLRPFNGDLA